MRRRDFITLISGAATGWPLGARAQQAAPIRLVGMLMGFAETDPTAQSLVTEFTSELTRLGWKSGSNLRIELRWGAGDTDRIRALAKELVGLQPDAIFGQTTPVVDALAHETQKIPIVFVTVSDPIGSGFAKSLTHPGGNITGFTFVESAMGGKWVELLREIAPNTEHVALLFNPATAPPLKFYMPSIQGAASSFGIQVLVTPVHAKEEIEAVVAAQGNAGGSLIVMPDAFNAANHELIISLAARYDVPALYGNDFARSGGLISYGSDFSETFHLAAGYIDRILKGAKAGELPIQLPTKFNLTLNLKTAKTLGLTVPQSLRVAADEVIE
jgi:putative tryptophan/tyrosine transport system substrate-binding protein